MRKVFITFVFCVSILGFALTSDAATYYVATTGNDSNAGTISAPFRTINRGFSALVPFSGDILYIRGGTYIENLNGSLIPSGTSYSNAVTISGYPGEIAVNKPSIGRSGAQVIDLTGSNHSYIHFKDFVFDADYPNIQPTVTGTPSVKTGNGSHHLRFTNVELKNCGSSGFIVNGSDSTFMEFINVKVHNTGLDLNYGPGGNGIYIESADNLVDGGEFYMNTRGNGVRFGISGTTGPSGNNNVLRNAIIHDDSLNSGNGGGVAVWDNDNVIYNNVFYHTNGAAIAVGRSNYARRTKILNNTIYNHSIGGSLSTGIELWTPQNQAVDTVIKNNLFYSNGAPEINGPGIGDVVDNNMSDQSGYGIEFVVSNPNFVNVGANNFHLQSNSPAINQGSVSSEFTTDKDGNIRVANYDIGAYEYGGTVPSTLLGDINNDRIVNSLDWSLMSSKWLTNDTNADLNKDGAVNSLDWSIMSGNWLKTI